MWRRWGLALKMLNNCNSEFSHLHSQRCDLSHLVLSLLEWITNCCLNLGRWVSPWNPATKSKALKLAYEAMCLPTRRFPFPTLDIMLFGVSRRWTGGGAYRPVWSFARCWWMGKLWEPEPFLSQFVLWLTNSESCYEVVFDEKTMLVCIVIDLKYIYIYIIKKYVYICIHITLVTQDIKQGFLSCQTLQKCLVRSKSLLSISLLGIIHLLVLRYKKSPCKASDLGLNVTIPVFKGRLLTIRNKKKKSFLGLSSDWGHVCLCGKRQQQQKGVKTCLGLSAGDSWRLLQLTCLGGR